MSDIVVMICGNICVIPFIRFVMIAPPIVINCGIKLAIAVTNCGNASVIVAIRLGKFAAILENSTSTAFIISGNRSLTKLGIFSNIVGKMFSTSPLTNVPTFPITVSTCGKTLLM